MGIVLVVACNMLVSQVYIVHEPLTKMEVVVLSVADQDKTSHDVQESCFSISIWHPQQASCGVKRHTGA